MITPLLTIVNTFFTIIVKYIIWAFLAEPIGDGRGGEKRTGHSSLASEDGWIC